MSILPHSASPVLQVSDLDKAFTFYTTVLGFTETFRYGTYGGVMSGKVSFHLCSYKDGPNVQPTGASSVYCFVESPAEVDACYAQILANGGSVKVPPENQPYGMRDFCVRDPDGNILTFGAEVETAKAD